MKEYKLARSGIAPHIQAQSNAPTLLTQSSLTNTINLVPNDTFALSRGGTELKQSSTNETIPKDSLNRIYVMELLTNPPRKNFRVLEAEVAKSLSSELSAHHNNPNIANFGNDII